jgi:hypothetical protein
VEGGATLNERPRSPGLAGTRPPYFLLADSEMGRFKRDDLRHIPVRRFYQSLITTLLTASAAESDVLLASEYS